MTTVAWDGKTLAADTLMMDGERGRFCETNKIHDCGDYVAAGAGEVQSVLLVMPWVLDGMKPDTKPRIEGDVEILVIEKATGKAVLLEKLLVPIPVPPCIAIGSGCCWAMAAMDHGRDAVEAIEYAKGRDTGTGYGTTKWEFERRGP